MFTGVRSILSAAKVEGDLGRARVVRVVSCIVN
jgi:hypothetical protein